MKRVSDILLDIMVEHLGGLIREANATRKPDAPIVLSIPSAVLLHQAIIELHEQREPHVKKALIELANRLEKIKP